MSWHLTVISFFIVGTSVYLASHWNDEAGWWLTILLLLGFTAVYNNGKPDFSQFAQRLHEVGF